MQFDEARHLLSRTSFGFRHDELEAMRRLSYTEGVERLISSASSRTVDTPEWLAKPLSAKRWKELSAAEREIVKKERRRRSRELKIWWYRQMIASDRQIVEWMTRFWHGHFTSELKKVKWPLLMFRQNRLFREHALGNFKTLLHAVAKDGAMMIYLDTVRNQKRDPNENFARELLELFTLGEGHYTEHDIKNAARAFTGWGVDRRTGSFRFRARRHDDGMKRFLGEKGRFGGEEIVDIVLRQPQTARFVSAKLFRALTGLSPDDATVNRLGELFYRSGYEIRPLLRAILLSDTFRDPANRGAMVKSPAELIVGTLRVLPLKRGSLENAVRLGRFLGEDLFDPSGVKGFPENREWITSDTLLLRETMMRKAARKAVPSHALASLEPETMRRWLLPVDPAIPIETASVRRTLEAIVTDPAYQLK
ncbi:DUF1800 domain-containing protein [Hydrogenimonas sp.]|uniref:DUF1800 domain-containing protein n=1 Tax=Hydrogenimonas sp. TaxID=2231112 RepID=UPI00260C0B4F|nr:DUF1800 domain-containing protein [Hydrogenimonas sp.]